MRIDVITIFPDYLGPLGLSLMGKAADSGVLTLAVHDLRTYATDKHRTVDDSPYGGGPGMVMRPEPGGLALDDVLREDSLLVVPTPSGMPFRQSHAVEWSTRAHLVFACGRYEGIDRRVVEHYRERVDVAEMSIGDYVLAGGEVASMVMIEAVTRLIPGVVGNPQSVVDDSFAPGSMADLLEGPVYTRPVTWRGHEVPPVLLSGNHAAIAAWRAEQARQRTAAHRPDLDSARPDLDSGRPDLDSGLA